jgi:phosphoribosylamine--glycine ligase
MIKVMIIDGGARGHALAKAYLGDQQVDEVCVAPGNDGMRGDFINGGDLLDESLQTDSSVSLKDIDSMVAAAKRFQPHLIDVAQDDALAAGAVDRLTKEGYDVFGPTQAAARIESDKAWSREFMQRRNIPHPKFRVFERTPEDIREAVRYALDLLDGSNRVFFKAAGLYAGKGVVPATHGTIDEAIAAIQAMGPASERFLVEQGMIGQEFSYFAMCDGTNAIFFNSAQDNKRLLNGDEGPNTGGMGAHSPALVTKGLEARIQQDIMLPALRGMEIEGTPYRGILYLGGIVLPDRSVKVVEFNSRWGDPECHVILPSIAKPGYSELVEHAMNGTLDQARLEQDNLARVSIVGASRGYPGTYPKDRRIYLDRNRMRDLAGDEDIEVLSAGIKVKDDNLYTNGGRLFAIVGKGEDLYEARVLALQAMACCSIPDNGLHYRTDIAWRDIDAE